MSVLEKNLNLIAEYNPDLKAQVLAISAFSNKIGLVETALEEPNLVLNNLPLHCQKGAEAEAKKIFAQVKNTPTSMQVVFGLGIGHLFKEFCENSKGRVIVYEPNIEILRATFEMVDFTRELAQENVFITSTLSDFNHIFKSIFGYKFETTFSSLPSYRRIYQKNLENIIKQVEICVGVCTVDYNSLRRKSDVSVEMLMKNIPFLLKETPLDRYRGVYKGKTAMIISAGPSLDLNIELIKQNRDKFVIFAVGTALKTLIKNDITPDFLGIIELNDCSSQIEGIDLSNINLILEPYTHNVFHQLKTKNTFVFATENAYINQAWAKLFEVNIKGYKTRGTVSYLGLFSAQMLGCKKIILVGQDLAYVGGRCYSAGSKYSDLVCKPNSATNKMEVTALDLKAYGRSLLPAGTEFSAEMLCAHARYNLEQFNKTLYYVKGIDGKMLPTQAGYATFIEHFKAFALEFSHLELINSSMIGANIEGFKNVALQEVVQKLEPITDSNELTHKDVYNKKNITKKLNIEQKILELILTKLSRAKGFIEKYEREFSRKNELNEAGCRAFKQLLIIYDEIVRKDLPKSLFYEALAIREDLDVQYMLKLHSNLDEQGFNEIFGALKTYFINVEQKIRNHISTQQNINID